MTTPPNHPLLYPTPVCADLSSRWFANSKQVPTGLPTALSVHKSPSSAVNHNNAASNSDNLERPCVKFPIYARFPADRFESALLCTVLLSGAANMSPELCDTLLFRTPLEQRCRLQNSSHLLVFDLHRVPLPSCHAPLLWLVTFLRQPWSCWADFKIHSSILACCGCKTQAVMIKIYKKGRWRANFWLACFPVIIKVIKEAVTHYLENIRLHWWYI